MAYEHYPENIEILYWCAVGLAGAGNLEEALPRFEQVFRQNPKWKDVTKRLPEVDLLPDDKKMMKKILKTE